MVLVIIFLLCSIVFSKGQRLRVTLDADRPFVRKQVLETVTLECCYGKSGGDYVAHTWIVSKLIANSTHDLQRVNVTDLRFKDEMPKDPSKVCHKLILMALQTSDAGLYQCFLNNSQHGVKVLSHGTFLQVYKPMGKILNLSENVKNNILTAQGILLLLCVLLPGAKLLFKTKQIHVLEKKKAMREEENIYEGLRIEDFSSPYDQIQRAPAETNYEDVYSEGEASLEKP
ncbi:B-cell antigen receptor complex-associated protein alpha chain isoform X2 [Gadus morhua]|uniref:B-cell antigen receptor complex-associated protein alpha chain isoform X2 n=1 Tax=Gadus morhua TaxID=8049 RepID=UPI0011B456DC|nr:B-cell antigen receptor complex-associated protein alpha chain isoform X2 [Gadus morhua]